MNLEDTAGRDHDDSGLLIVQDEQASRTVDEDGNPVPSSYEGIASARPTDEDGNSVLSADEIAAADGTDDGSTVDEAGDDDAPSTDEEPQAGI